MLRGVNQSISSLEERDKLATLRGKAHEEMDTRFTTLERLAGSVPTKELANNNKFASFQARLAMLNQPQAEEAEETPQEETSFLVVSKQDPDTPVCFF